MMRKPLVEASVDVQQLLRKLNLIPRRSRIFDDGLNDNR
jgi:hypothetical protein